MRASIKLYFSYGLKTNQRNPKKTWELLKEAANLHRLSEGVEKIQVNNVTINDPGKIASPFNEFFCQIGTEISNSIGETDAKPEDFMPNIPNLVDLEL